MFDKTDLERINKTVNIPKLLVKLGAEERSIKQLYSKPDFRCPCWFRGGDNENGLGVTFNPHKCKWMCTDFTHRTFGNIDLFDFIGKLTNLSFLDAVKLAESCCEGTESSLDVGTLLANSNANLGHPVPLETHILNTFIAGLHPYLHKRGYTPETAKYFNLGFANCGEMVDRVTIPIYDESGTLVSVQGRTFVDDDVRYKFIEGTGDSAKLVLYNYKNAIESAKRKGWLLVVEGCPSVWRLHQYGLKNVVATMSTSVTDRQVQKLIDANVKIVIFFDSDENNAGLYGTNKLARNLQTKGAKNVYFTNLRYQKIFGSPDDATKEQIAIALKGIKKLF